MILKTSGKLHFQEADEFHFEYNETDDFLELYWGEPKMEKTITSALSNCFGSITPILTDPNSYDSTQNRDLRLITANISNNINYQKFEDFLVKFFYLDSDYFNKLNFKGIYFIFNVENYPTKPKEKTSDQFLNEFKLKLNIWGKSIETQYENHSDIKNLEINIF